MTIRTRRPRNIENRDECIAAVEGVESRVGLHPITHAIATVAYVAIRDAYHAAFDRASDASAEVVVARESLVGVESDWDTAFRLWKGTVTDDEGKDLAEELRGVLGMPPGQLVRAKPRTKIKVVRREHRVLAASPRLRGDAARLEALRSSTGALASAVALFEAALRSRKSAVAKFKDAAAAHDRVYGTLADAILDYDPEFAENLPVFFRTAKEAELVEDRFFDDADDEIVDPEEVEVPEPEAVPPAPAPATAAPATEAPATEAPEAAAPEAAAPEAAAPEAAAPEVVGNA